MYYIKAMSYIELTNPYTGCEIQVHFNNQLYMCGVKALLKFFKCIYKWLQPAQYNYICSFVLEWLVPN